MCYWPGVYVPWKLHCGYMERLKKYILEREIIWPLLGPSSFDGGPVGGGDVEKPRKLNRFLGA